HTARAVHDPATSLPRSVTASGSSGRPRVLQAQPGSILPDSRFGPSVEPREPQEARRSAGATCGNDNGDRGCGDRCSSDGAVAVAVAERKHRSLGQQLNRSPGVLRASWMIGLALLVAGVSVGAAAADLPGLPLAV
ncbi:MAG: hypothetical protein QOC82_1403, partial [Frankiaceae bacterium]|nr:hypothetical protein [Frankiaceae bacterium]